MWWVVVVEWWWWWVTSQRWLTTDWAVVGTVQAREIRFSSPLIISDIGQTDFTRPLYLPTGGLTTIASLYKTCCIQSSNNKITSTLPRATDLDTKFLRILTQNSLNITESNRASSVFDKIQFFCEGSDLANYSKL